MNSILVSGVIRQKLWYLANLRVLKILEQPYKSPRVVARSGAQVGARKVSARFDVSRVAQRMKLAEQKDGEYVRTSRAQKNGSSDFPLFQLLLFLHQRDGVVMDGVRDLVTQSSGKL